MGCGSSSLSLTYSIPTTRPDDAKGESAIYRNPMALNGLKSMFSQEPHLRTLQDIMLNACKVYSNRPFLGTREVLADGKLGKYHFKTYAEVLEISQQVGTNIIKLDLAPIINEYNNMPFRFVATYAKNREEYLMLDLACILYGITVIPIYDTLGPESVHFTFAHTNLTTVFAANQFVDSLIKGFKEGKCGNLRSIVSFGPPTEAQINEAKIAGINLLQWSDLIKNDKPLTYESITPESIYAFSYTSGTTGIPKGAMLSHGNVVATIVSAEDKPDVQFLHTDVHLSYLPMAHVLERVFMWCFIKNGASIGFFGGDVLKLKEDIQELRPTIFPSVPRLFNKFYDAMMGNIEKLTGAKKTLAQMAITKKLENLHNNAEYTHSIYDALVFKKTKEALGGRVRFMLTGSAPISEKVIDFLKIAICCPILEAYGQTESSAASFSTLASDGYSGHVGGPLTSIEFKVVDVPEMNYTSNDRDEKGLLLPRGEICLRGPTVFKGYYKDPEKTNEAIDKDGWLHTGDIGQINQNGALKIIDRKKNIFKLAIGEYIAAEKIENIYLRSKYIAEVFIYGDSLQHYLIGIVVPQQPAIEALAKELKIEESFESLCINPVIIAKVLEEMNKLGRNEKLLSFELAKKIKLEPISFNIKGLFTPSFKLKRHEAKLHYKSEIERMYAEPLIEKVNNMK